MCDKLRNDEKQLSTQYYKILYLLQPLKRKQIYAFKKAL